MINAALSCKVLSPMAVILILISLLYPHSRVFISYLGSPTGSISPHLILLPMLVLFSGSKHSHAEEAHMCESQLHFVPILMSIFF